MSDQSWTSTTEWLSIPDVAELLGETLGRVHRLIDDNALVAIRVDGVRRIPAAFFVDGELLSSLRGTLIVLADAGFSDEEAVRWLMEPEETIGMPPMEALRAGRKSEVRRVARALA